MFGNSQAGGGDISGPPDVCFTPPPTQPMPKGTPTPYVNRTRGCQATGASTKVMFNGSPAHNLGTNYKISEGDEGGFPNGGVKSGTIKGRCQHLTGANTVLVQGKPTTRTSSSTTQNDKNTTGTRADPSQTKVQINGG